MRPAPSCAAPASPARHQRHRPEETTLYRVVQAHLDTYLAFVDIETGGAGLPTFVTDEFDAFLACGILAHGFLRLRCDGCAEEHYYSWGVRAHAKNQFRHKIEMARASSQTGCDEGAVRLSCSRL